MQTKDQTYAAKIFMQVSAVAEGDRKKYGAMAHKLPILIRTAGLAQALAYVEARSETPTKLLLDHLAEVVGAGSRQQLLVHSRTASLSEYMRLTRDALAALLWYKRFAQSVLGVDASDEGGSI